MPGRNGTGPLGKGPLTGGQRGNCRQEDEKAGYRSRSDEKRGKGQRSGNRYQGATGTGSRSGNGAGQSRRGNGNR